MCTCTYLKGHCILARWRCITFVEPGSAFLSGDTRAVSLDWPHSNSWGGCVFAWQAYDVLIGNRLLLSILAKWSLSNVIPLRGCGTKSTVVLQFKNAMWNSTDANMSSLHWQIKCVPSYWVCTHLLLVLCTNLVATTRKHLPAMTQQGNAVRGSTLREFCTIKTNLEKILTVRLTLLNLIFCWTYKYIFAQNTTIKIVALGMDDNMDWRNNYSNQ